MPSIHDKFEESGDINSEYFWQDLYVAQLVFKSKVETHFDIGSRIDGFVAHVASFMNINILDIRNLNSNTINITFNKLDITKFNNKYLSITNSLSCLHTYEHFGLGRYGDNINPNARFIAFENMVKMLKPYSNFYFSTPIGKSVIFFNSHRVSSIVEILHLFNKYNLRITQIAYRDLHNFTHIYNDIQNEQLDFFNNNEYTLVIFTLSNY